MGKIGDYPHIPAITGDEKILLVKDGVSYHATLADLESAAPQNGLYPDVPLNYVEIRRFAGQTSTTVVVNGNMDELARVVATAFPCTIDRNANIVAYLNGQDVTKTVDGLAAVLDDWTQPAMVRMGGFWTRYFYDASTNTKVTRFSTKKVRGYKYKRRRFLNMFGGTVENHDGKDMLLSNAGKWTTQSRNIMQYHAAAKNLGDSFREIATQDREVYRDYFWLIEKTYNSQTVLRGICDVNWSWWGAFSQAANGGQGSYAQFHQTGVTTSIKGHKGETSITVNNGESDVTVKPYKWLWRENMLSGPYWIWETGYLKVGGVWYKANNINTNVSWDVTDGNWTRLCDECPTSGWILENFEDTLIVTQVGASETTGLADYYWRGDNMDAKYIPAGVGHAYDGSNVGGSVLDSSNDVSNASTNFGGALASDDPSDPTPDGTVAA